VDAVEHRASAQDTGRDTENAHARQGVGGAVEVMGMVLRVAGPVACRVDMQFAGAPERQLGLSMGTVLIYLRSHYTALKIARAWSSAAPLAASLAPVLTGSKRGVMAPTGPWSTATMVRLNGSPNVTGGLIEPVAGTKATRMLRMRVGPLVWELCDGAAFAATVKGWKLAADMLAVDSDDT
jgi:hypothetical protein